ncbi:MAG: TIM barrel protein [Rikenellaceae bacterium]
MNRRDFLRKGAAATATTLVGVSSISSLLGFSSCASSEPKEKIIGLQLYSLRDAFGRDVPGTLAKIAAMGYKSLETASYNDGKLYGYAPTEFRKMVEDLGMKVTSAHLGKWYDPENQSQTNEWWNVALDAQAAAGCKYTIMPSFPIGETLDDIKVYSDYFNSIADIAASKGIKFGFHNHAGEFAQRDGVVIQDYLIENANDNMIFQLDVYWAQHGGVNPADYIIKYGDKIKLLHIKDESIIGDSGTMDFEAIFIAAYSVGIEDYYVEVEQYSPLPPEGCVEKSYEFLEVAPYVK